MVDHDPLERRRHRRHDVLVPARYWIDDPGHAIACDLLDISEGGVCVSLTDWSSLDLAGEATLELPIPGSERALSTPVEIKGVGGERQPVLRMRFLDTSSAFRHRIGDVTVAWIRSCAR